MDNVASKNQTERHADKQQTEIKHSGDISPSSSMKVEVDSQVDQDDTLIEDLANVELGSKGRSEAKTGHAKTSKIAPPVVRRAGSTAAVTLREPRLRLPRPTQSDQNVNNSGIYRVEGLADDTRVTDTTAGCGEQFDFSTNRA